MNEHESKQKHVEWVSQPEPVVRLLTDGRMREDENQYHDYEQENTRDSWR